MSPGTLLLPLDDRFFRSVLAGLSMFENEVLLLVYLGRAGAFLGDELITGGTRRSHAMPYRRLFERAFDRDAAGLVLAHNHPSGSADRKSVV